MNWGQAMTNRPWTPEHAVTPELARELIEEQFPDLAPVRIEPLGDGWDNTAFLVCGEWVFRFPRREVAVALIETECALLPSIAPHVPLPIPVPLEPGRPGPRFPWPFAGYRRIPGRSACGAELEEAQRRRAAAPLARFLSALHAFPADEAALLGAGPDTLGRLDVTKRCREIEKRLAEAQRLGLLDDPGPWRAIAEAAPRSWTPRDSILVHGDFYSRHVLVDDAGLPCGVIDWGDVHLGEPALDLSIAHGFLPRSAHDAFRDAYGPIDEDTWAMARFRALQSATVTLVYGHDVGDEALMREARTALRHLVV